MPVTDRSQNVNRAYAAVTQAMTRRCEPTLWPTLETAAPRIVTLLTHTEGEPVHQRAAHVKRILQEAVESGGDGGLSHCDPQTLDVLARATIGAFNAVNGRRPRPQAPSNWFG